MVLLLELVYNHPILLLLLTLVLGWYFLFSGDGKPRPPGPWGLPILGYLPFLGRKMNIGLTKLQAVYGDVYTVAIGTRKIVVLNGNRTIKEALAPGKADFSGRPDFWTYTMANTAFGFKDWCPAYRTLRKIAMKGLGMFSNVRNDGLQEVANKAADDFIEICKEHKNEPFNPKDDLYFIVCGIMGYICYGKQFTKDDEELKQILGSADEVGKTVVAGVLVDYIPSLSILMKGQMKRYRSVMGKIRGYSASLVAKCITKYDPDNLTTVADALQKASHEMPDEEKESLQIDDRYIKGMIGNLFGAGFGTIAITLRWAMMLLAKHPDEQDKLFQELDELLGADGRLQFKDNSKLPYTQAVIAEVYRYSSIASVAITHKATQDTWFKGYFIEKETPVIVNIYSGHFDERVFQNARQFNPDRFIKQDGSFDAELAGDIMPFGLGHRRCGGEALAKLEIFIFLATIFHKTKVVEVPGEPLDPVNGYAFTFGLDPNPFRVSFESRYAQW